MDTLRKQLKKSGNGMISQKEKESPISEPQLEGKKSHRLSTKALSADTNLGFTMFKTIRNKR